MSREYQPSLLLILLLLCNQACTTIAEVRKRGHEFWDEFELYLSDLFIGLVLDVVLVSPSDEEWDPMGPS